MNDQHLIMVLSTLVVAISLAKSQSMISPYLSTKNVRIDAINHFATRQGPPSTIKLGRSNEMTPLSPIANVPPSKATVSISAIDTFNPMQGGTSMPIRLTATPGGDDTGLLAIAGTSGASIIIAPSSPAWTKCTDAFPAPSVNVPRITIFYRMYKPGDPTTFTFTSTLPDFNPIQVFTVKHVNPYTPFVCKSYAESIASTASPWYPIMASNANSIALASIVTRKGEHLLNPPSGFSLSNAIAPQIHYLATYASSNLPRSAIYPEATIGQSDLTASSLVIANAHDGNGDPYLAEAHPTSVEGKIHSTVLGANTENRFLGAPQLKLAEPLATQIGLRAARWPSGFLGDVFDWASTNGQLTRYCNYNRVANDPSGTFDEFMQTFAIPAHIDTEINVNYATGQSTLTDPSKPWNSAVCDTGGDPRVAAAWVDYANNTKHDKIQWWEVGNETWNSNGDGALQPTPVSTASSYALNEPAFFSSMKEKDSEIKIGIPVENYPKWDPIVLRGAKYDYLAYHWYPYSAANVTDEGALSAPYLNAVFTQPSGIGSSIWNLREEMIAAGKCSSVSACTSAVPISISEWNSVENNGSEQLFSIVGGLFAAEALGEMFDAGVQRAEIYDFAVCNRRALAVAKLYGWQGNLSDWGIVAPFERTNSRGIGNCEALPGDVVIPPGAILPEGRAMQMYSESGFATEGADALLVDQPYADVHAYASHFGSTYVFMLINANRYLQRNVKLGIDQVSGGSHYLELQYSKAIYDRTKDNGPWDPPSKTHGGRWTVPMAVDLPPWSMTTLTLREAK